MLAYNLQVSFVVLTVLGAVALASSFVQYALIDRLLTDPVSITLADLTASDDRQQALGLLQSFSYIGVGIIFLMWTHRLTRNLPALGSSPRYSPGWAVGWWLIPIANLWMPWKVISEIHAGSQGRPRATHGADRIIWLVNVWWFTFVAGALLNGSAPDAIESRSDGLFYVVSDLIWLSGAVLAFWVVRLMTRAHLQAAAERHLAPQPPPDTTAPWVPIAALPAIAVIITLAAVLLWLP